MATEEGLVSLPTEKVEGNITVPTAAEDEEDGTLDEPVAETLKRDVSAVLHKFTHVLIPRRSKALLHDWDLWGPLVLCVLLAIFLQGSSNDHGPQFVEVFVLVWAGSIVVTLNSKLLGGSLSVFQSLCTLGYCLLPPVLALICCHVILFATQSVVLFTMRLAIVAAGFGWAVWAALAFLSDSHPPKRKGLAMYPVFLFYFGISYLILSKEA